MDVATALIEEAKHVARSADGRARQIQAELDEIEAKKLTVDAELDRVQGMAKRLFNYQPRAGPHFQCPRCWIRDEIRASVRPILGTDEHDILRCGTCGADLVIPIR